MSRFSSSGEISMKRSKILLMLVLLLPAASAALAGDEPAPVPVTRPEIKQVLEGSKHSRPRLPLPPLTEEERQRVEQVRAGQDRGVFGGIVNNGRMRNYYLAPELRSEFTSRAGNSAGRGNDPKAAVRAGASDPSMPLDPTFRVMFFWLIARLNNCYYCLGHQEVKLKSAGVSDDQLAALDTDWSAFTPAERAAFAFVRKLGRKPQEIGEEDTDALRKHYNDREILDIIVSTGGFASMTRWTGGLMIPQEEHRVYLTPTSEPYRDRRSVVAPLDASASGTARVCPAAAANRPPLESRGEVEAKLSACRSRSPRLPLVAEDKARALLPADWPTGALPQWVRLLANFPEAGKTRILSLHAARDKGSLDRTLRAQIAWIAARQDRAWYALGHARQRLRELGQSDDAIFALDGPHDGFGEGRRAVFTLARKLTVDPALVTDADVAAVRKHFSDRETAEVVYFVTVAAFFDRVTEACGLQLEF
jgi:alkylhydroperoxidase family enzyme